MYKLKKFFVMRYDYCYFLCPQKYLDDERFLFSDEAVTLDPIVSAVQQQIIYSYTIVLSR